MMFHVLMISITYIIFQFISGKTNCVTNYSFGTFWSQVKKSISNIVTTSTWPNMMVSLVEDHESVACISSLWRASLECFKCESILLYTQSAKCTRHWPIVLSLQSARIILSVSSHCTPGVRSGQAPLDFSCGGCSMSCSSSEGYRWFTFDSCISDGSVTYTFFICIVVSWTGRTSCYLICQSTCKSTLGIAIVLRLGSLHCLVHAAHIITREHG